MPLRIVGLGDSTTAGTPGFLSPLEAPPDGQGNPQSQYAYWMMKAHPDWTVLNRGISGQSSDEVLDRFHRDVVLEAPDYVVILAGVNDVYRGYPREFVQRNLHAMYEQAIDEKIMALPATILPYNMASSSELAEIHELNHWIERTAQTLGILFTDTYRAVSDPEHPDCLRSSPDGLHPDVSGYRSMGEALTKMIEGNLARKKLTCKKWSGNCWRAR